MEEGGTTASASNVCLEPAWREAEGADQGPPGMEKNILVGSDLPEDPPMDDNLPEIEEEDSSPPSRGKTKCFFPVLPRRLFHRHDRPK